MGKCVESRPSPSASWNNYGKFFFLMQDCSTLSKKRDLIDSPTALQSDSSIVRQSYRQHVYDMHGIFKFCLFSFKLIEETLKYTHVQSRPI